MVLAVLLLALLRRPQPDMLALSFSGITNYSGQRAAVFIVTNVSAQGVSFSGNVVAGSNLFWPVYPNRGPFELKPHKTLTFAAPIPTNGVGWRGSVIYGEPLTDMDLMLRDLQFYLANHNIIQYGRRVTWKGPQGHVIVTPELHE